MMISLPKLTIKKDGDNWLVFKEYPAKEDINKFPIARLKSLDEAEKFVERFKNQQKNLGF